ncbi:hypothetical protein [uncultured Tateyamaria sp.]|uniref:hypothetical protein n=1 Tax=uncultured Tateyamaria sp. TaxID=455651 RepID=UPI0026029AA6|nr:hypothetical protein [uncultured Tateyamaria sp.]
MSEHGLPPVFLERRSYRRRRMMDALRLLPILGLFLWMLPLFWPTAADGPGAPDKMAMSTAVTYVFAVWLTLIGSALALWSFLRSSPEMGEDANAEPR